MMRQPRALMASALLLGSVVTAHGMAFGGAQTAEALEGLRRGIQLVDDGDFTQAIAELEGVVIALESLGATPSDIASAYFYLGVALTLEGVSDDDARLAFWEAQQHDPLFRPSESAFPRRVMSLWEDARTLPPAAPAVELAGTLRVTSTPPGATVYVAGQLRGETPVDVSDLPAGDHRITLVLADHEPDVSIVALAPGQPELVQVELEESGGGGWWRWAALAGGGGAAAALLMPRNKPPSASLSISPSGVGMAGVTQYAFNGGASSDPDGDPLTFSWSFGDGSSGSGRQATHVYSSPGSYNVSLTVSDGKESDTETGSVDVSPNLDGAVFESPLIYPVSASVDFRKLSMRLAQSGGNLTGRVSATLSLRNADVSTDSTSISGSLSGSDFVCPCTIELAGGWFGIRGTLESGASTISGARVVILWSGEVRTWNSGVFQRR